VLAIFAQHADEIVGQSVVRRDLLHAAASRTEDAVAPRRGPERTVIGGPKSYYGSAHLGNCHALANIVRTFQQVNADRRAEIELAFGRRIVDGHRQSPRAGQLERLHLSAGYPKEPFPGGEPDGSGFVFRHRLPGVAVDIVPTHHQIWTAMIHTQQSIARHQPDAVRTVFQQ
jgi:hypothetical protein